MAWSDKYEVWHRSAVLIMQLDHILNCVALHDCQGEVKFHWAAWSRSIPFSSSKEEQLGPEERTGGSN